MSLERPWSALENRLKQVAESAVDWSPVRNREDDDLVKLGLVETRGELTERGNAYYMAKFVLADVAATRTALADFLKENEVVTAFCERTWAAGEVPKDGAVSLLKRIMRSPRDDLAKRWLSLMNDAGIIVYNRSHPKIRVLYNPTELLPPDEEAEREKFRGHLISPETPYGNLVALRELVRSARGTIRWYEQHMPAKVLEVLHGQVERGSVSAIRILSGPANVDQSLKDDFMRFAAEMKRERQIDTQWRVLDKKESFKHHDRHFLADGIARNLPPVNSILANSSGEILESGVTSGDFDKWWDQGVDLVDVTGGERSS